MKEDTSPLQGDGNIQFPPELMESPLGQGGNFFSLMTKDRYLPPALVQEHAVAIEDSAPGPGPKENRRPLGDSIKQEAPRDPDIP